MDDQVIAIAVADMPPPVRLLDRTGREIWRNIPAALRNDVGALPAVRLPGLSAGGSRVTLELLNLPARDVLAEARGQEAEHRSRNIVSLAVAVARQSLREDLDRPRVIAFIERLRSLEAVVRIGCEVEGDLCSVPLIARRVTERFQDKARPQVVRSGPDVSIAARWAHLIAMVLHELAANAIRHGALSVPEGRVDLNWSVSEPDEKVERFRLTWRERGGPTVPDLPQLGTGLRILRELTSGSLRSTGTLDMPPDGLRYDLCLLVHRREIVRR